MFRGLVRMAFVFSCLVAHSAVARAEDRPPPSAVESPIKWRLHLSEGGKSSYYGLWRDGGTIPLTGRWTCRYSETRSHRNRTRNAIEEAVTIACRLDDALVDSVVACSYPGNPQRSALVSPSDSGHLVLRASGTDYRAFVMVTCRTLSSETRRRTR